MTGSSLLLVLVLGGLLLAAGAVATAISALWALIAGLLSVLFFNLRALAVIVLLIACVVFIAHLGGPPTSPGVG